MAIGLVVAVVDIIVNLHERWKHRQNQYQWEQFSTRLIVSPALLHQVTIFMTVSVSKVLSGMEAAILLFCAITCPHYTKCASP